MLSIFFFSRLWRDDARLDFDNSVSFSKAFRLMWPWCRRRTRKISASFSLAARRRFIWPSEIVASSAVFSTVFEEEAIDAGKDCCGCTPFLFLYFFMTYAAARRKTIPPIVIMIIGNN